MSLSVQVQMFSVFRELAGGTEGITAVLQEGASLRDLVMWLGETYGRAFIEAVLLPDGSGLVNDTTVLLNGRNVSTQQGLDAELRHGDCVAILISISGG